MQKCKTVNDSPSWDLKKNVCYPLATGWFQPPSKAMAQIRLQSHDFWTYPDDSRRDWIAHAPVPTMPGKLSSYTGSKVLTFQLGSGSRVGRILLLSWDDIPLKSQAPCIQSSRNMTLKNLLDLIDLFCQSDRSLWQDHFVLFLRHHYNRVLFLSEVKLPIFPKTGNAAALRHQILNQFVNLKSHVLI